MHIFKAVDRPQRKRRAEQYRHAVFSSVKEEEYLPRDHLLF